MYILRKDFFLIVFPVIEMKWSISPGFCLDFFCNPLILGTSNSSFEIRSRVTQKSSTGFQTTYGPA